LVEVISGGLRVELLADAGNVFFVESRSCKAVKASQRFDLRRLRKEVNVSGQ
jgi:DNA-binding MurR/RpiR family transcriptional regulator